jgi:hypothetical protein
MDGATCAAAALADIKGYLIPELDRLKAAAPVYTLASIIRVHCRGDVIALHLAKLANAARARAP